MSTTDRIAAIRARLAAATPGPWSFEREPATWDLHGHITVWLSGTNEDGTTRNAEPDGEDFTPDDLVWLAEAHRDLAWLLDQLEATQARAAAKARQAEKYANEANTAWGVVADREDDVWFLRESADRLGNENESLLEKLEAAEARAAAAEARLERAEADAAVVRRLREAFVARMVSHESLGDRFPQTPAHDAITDQAAARFAAEGGSKCDRCGATAAQLPDGVCGPCGVELDEAGQ